MKKKSSFDQHTETWFDKLALFKAMYPGTHQVMLETACKSPTKANVQELFKECKNLCPALGRHCQAVIDKKFSSEFRFAFGESTPRTGCDGFMKVSAASCLFSLVRQALMSEQPIRPEETAP
jgi:hypothetical protein